ncbi:MAG: hypothetical protein R2856_39395 [Caldilineaceae bacterium]
MLTTWMKYREDLEEIVLARTRASSLATRRGRWISTPSPRRFYEAGEHTDCCRALCGTTSSRGWTASQ